MAARKVLHLTWLKPLNRAFSKSAPSVNGAEIKSIRQHLSQFKGGSIDLLKDEVSGVATVTINNPDKKNAFTGSMMVQLADVVSELEAWNSGKGVLIHGAGGSLSSGGDLKFMKAIANPTDGARMSNLMQHTTHRFANLPLLSMVLIQGRALGGGAELAITSDFCIMTESASVGFVEIRLGIMPLWGATPWLVRTLGRKKALHILTSGHIFSSQEALAIGLIDDIVPDENSVERARSNLLEHLKGPREAIHAIKKAVMHACDEDIETALKSENAQAATVWGGPAHHAAIDKGLKHK